MSRPTTSSSRSWIGCQGDIIIKTWKKWTPKQEGILWVGIENYGKNRDDDKKIRNHLQSVLGREWFAILQHSRKMGLTFKYKWTHQEMLFLRDYYYDLPIDELVKFLNRTWDSIKIRAEKMGLVRSNRFMIHGDCSVLLLDTPEAYYWAGFIAADGHIENNIRLSICLSIVDDFHLLKFSKYIKHTENLLYYNVKSNNKTFENVNISIQDRLYIPKFAKKFDLKQRKTYDPPIINIKNDDFFVSFVFGFIDGDGSIRYQYKRTDSCMVIHIHSSWLKFLEMVNERLYDMFGVRCHVKILNDGYANLYSGNNYLLSCLKKKGMELGLPIMDRKWSKIKNNYPNKNKIMNDRFKMIKKLHNDGISKKNVAKILSLHYSVIALAYRKMKLNENMDDRAIKIKSLLDDGKSRREIASILSLEYGCVCSFIRNRGINKNIYGGDI